MAVDYPGAIDMIIEDPAWVFTDALLSVPNGDLTIVDHKTACGGQCTATSIAQGFHNDVKNHKSAHFVVGRDGSVIQVVLLKDGAGANCCLQPGHDIYWDRLLSKYRNLNVCTISIEHEDWTNDNSQTMTPEQIDASNKLNLWLVQKYSLSPNQIRSHASMRPGDRSRCPGPTFDFQALFSFLQSGGNMSGIPGGWHDDGTTLTAPNGHKVVLGFRDFILSHPWNPSDMPLEEEVYLNPLEESNTSLGAGSQQIFNLTALEYTKSKGVFVAYVGQELQFVRADRNKLRTELAAAQQQIATLQAKSSSGEEKE